MTQIFFGVFHAPLRMLNVLFHAPLRLVSRAVANCRDHTQMKREAIANGMCRTCFKSRAPHDYPECESCQEERLL